MATETQPIYRGRLESIRSGRGQTVSIAQGVEVREFVSKSCGAAGFSTGIGILDVGAALPYHTHHFSEAITVISGEVRVAVEGRRYLLRQFDCIHVPAETAHEAVNCSENSPLSLFYAFSYEEPSRDFVEREFAIDERGLGNPAPKDPESVVRFESAETYELSEGTEFRDLFAKRFGSVGICGGYGRFQPGASLPCHVHQYDESITIIEGEATCLVQGNRYQLSGTDTAFVPEGRVHRFLNHSSSPMAMMWVYAGNEPERTLVDPAYCDGTLTRSGKA